MYDTNGLTLNDLYPYGQEHGDTAETNGDLPIAPLLAPIDNLIGLPSHNPTATRYQVSIQWWNHQFDICTCLSYTHYFSFRLYSMVL